VIAMLRGLFSRLSRSKDKKKDIEDEFEVNEEFEEGEFDEFGGDLEDDANLEKTGRFTELESRIKDLENETGLISSKLNTIKAENEEIGKRLEEIEENIRKLLGIYEMDTEGINLIKIINSTGKAVLSKTVPQNCKLFNIEISDIKNGLYFIQYQNRSTN